MKKLLINLYFWGLTALFIPSQFPIALAALVDNLYETEVVVIGQGATERKMAMSGALGEILVRISGNRHINSLPGMEDTLGIADRYVQQYRYQEVSAQNAVVSAAGEQRLWVRFDEGAVNDLLRKLNMPVWSKLRPTLLVWLAVEQEGERSLLGANSEHALRQMVESEARRRGIPIMFPLLDLEDQSRVDVADVWGGFTETVDKASERYQAEGVLIGRLFQTPDGRWQAGWVFKQGKNNERKIFEGDSDLAVIGAGIDMSADVLAANFAQVLADAGFGNLIIRVDNVTNLETYARVQGYLASLTLVERMELLRVLPSYVIYRVVTQGDSAGVAKAIALGNVLVPQQMAAADIDILSDFTARGSKDNTVQVYRLFK